MILSIYYKFIYIHIPKTAGEWLTNKLRKSIRWDSQLIAYWGLDKHNDLDITHIHQKMANRYSGSKKKKVRQGKGKFSKKAQSGGESFLGNSRRDSPPGKFHRKKKPYRGQGK